VIVAFLGGGGVEGHVGGERELKVIRDVIKAFDGDGAGGLSGGKAWDLEKTACGMGWEKGGHRAG
jgi:hypothetical protein